MKDDSLSSNYKKNSPLVSEYLQRIGFNGTLDGSAATLSQLQECHLYTVPYENLDVVQRIPLSLEIPPLFEKIVAQRRGGYCFELNALFSWLLTELGYAVTDLFARFWRDEPNPPPKRRHHVLKVAVGEHFYLCDVGIGGVAPRRPIQLIANMAQTQENECYRLEQNTHYGWALCELKQEQWKWIYSFTEEPQLPKDYLMANFWCEYSPDSVFIHHPIAAIRTREGRTSLYGKEFRIFTDDGVQTFVPQTEEEFISALHTHFGITIAPPIAIFK